MKNRKVYYSYKSFLGYQKGADGQPEIAPDEAIIVRRIFSRYLLGQSVRQIATDLMADGFKTVHGGDVWHDGVIQRMLQNEKYIGDALLQKTYCEDLFTRKRLPNNGKLPKYYVHECHPAIIDKETFQKVQEEIARRSSIRRTSSRTKTELGKYSGKYVLSELLVCGECGSPYRRVIWTQKGEKRVVWRCINRLEHGKRICKHSPTWDESDIHAAVVNAINEKQDRQETRNALDESIFAALAGDAGEMTLRGIEAQLRDLQERQTELLHLAFSAGVDCVDYDDEIQKVNLEMMRLTEKRAEMAGQQDLDRAFELKVETLNNALDHIPNGITTFDEMTVRQLVSSIKVLDRERLLVCFRDGEQIIAEKEYPLYSTNHPYSAILSQGDDTDWQYENESTPFFEHFYRKTGLIAYPQPWVHQGFLFSSIDKPFRENGEIQEKNFDTGLVYEHYFPMKRPRCETLHTWVAYPSRLFSLSLIESL